MRSARDSAGGEVGGAPARRQPRRAQQGADGRAADAARGRRLRQRQDVHRERQRPPRRTGGPKQARLGPGTARRGRLRRDDGRRSCASHESSPRPSRRTRSSAPRTRTSRSSPGGPPRARPPGSRPSIPTPSSSEPSSSSSCHAACTDPDSRTRGSSRCSASPPRCGTGARSSRWPSWPPRRRLASTPSEGRTRWHWHASLRSRASTRTAWQQLKSEIEDGERPEGLPATELMILHDPEARAATRDRRSSTTRTTTAQGDELLSAMPARTRRASGPR